MRACEVIIVRRTVIDVRSVVETDEDDDDEEAKFDEFNAFLSLFA